MWFGPCLWRAALTSAPATPTSGAVISMECDHIILTGGVVYHFLAGYGGGPKYLLPGIASYETIQRHHNLALNKGFGSGTNAAVRSANMETSNIFHADLEEAALLAKPSFLLNVVVDDNYNIIKAVAGDMIISILLLKKFILVLL